MTKRGYQEGDWFLIKVSPKTARDWGASDVRMRYGAGLIARGKRGSIPFVYIFGPFFKRPTVSALKALEAGEAVTLKLISDAGIREGKYPILWHDPEFRREDWPMPEFAMWMGGDMPAIAVTRDQDNPGKTASTRRVSPEDALRLPQYSFGEGSLYRRLIFPEEPESRISDLYSNGTASEQPGVAWTNVRVDFLVPVARLSALIEELRRELSDEGWSVDPSRSPDHDTPTDARTWVTISRARNDSGTPSVEELAKLDRDMEQLAARLGIEYDGHGFGRDLSSG